MGAGGRDGDRAVLDIGRLLSLNDVHCSRYGDHFVAASLGATFGRAHRERAPRGSTNTTQRNGHLLLGRVSTLLLVQPLRAQRWRSRAVAVRLPWSTPRGTRARQRCRAVRSHTRWPQRGHCTHTQACAMSRLAMRPPHDRAGRRRSSTPAAGLTLLLLLQLWGAACDFVPAAMPSSSSSSSSSAQPRAAAQATAPSTRRRLHQTSGVVDPALSVVYSSNLTGTHLAARAATCHSKGTRSARGLVHRCSVLLGGGAGAVPAGQWTSFGVQLVDENGDNVSDFYDANLQVSAGRGELAVAWRAHHCQYGAACPACPLLTSLVACPGAVQHGRARARQRLLLLRGAHPPAPGRRPVQGRLHGRDHLVRRAALRRAAPQSRSAATWRCLAA